MPPLNVRPAGLVLDLSKRLVQGQVEPRLHNAPLWDWGLGDVIRTALEEGGVSNEPLTAVDLARKAGILKKKGRSG